ncbi:hypothetical protein DFQ27_002874, partial [Actinomortierella ambigua]
MRPSAKHAPLIEKAAREIRQDYVQRYLKQFLRRVHPDLFQHHPKEQAQNSASLQELLPIVGHDKQKMTANTPPAHVRDPPSLTANLSFYVRPITSAAIAASVAASETGSGSTKNATSRPLTLVEHNLPLPQAPIQAYTQHAMLNMQELEQELRSWEMVQSFMHLCTKVGVSVAEADQQYMQKQYQAVREAIQQASMGSSPQQAAKSLQEIFVEELQGSFAGSSGKTVCSTMSSSPSLSVASPASLAWK